jgi:Protein of unknown function (DUF2975)
MTNNNANLNWFRRLDQIFWLLWACLPIMMWFTYQAHLEAGVPLPGMTEEQQRCFKILPSIANLSAAGSKVYWAYFAFEHAIYFILFGLLHRMVRRFASGDILASDTLANLQAMGVVLLLWPFLSLIAANLLAYFWKQSGDMTDWMISYTIDLAPIAVGIFLIALKGVLEHAIALKTENDLTI